MSSKEYFDQVAGQWDEMRSAFFSDAVREKALAAAGVRPGESAADIGAGSGFITAGLLSRGLRVVAVDQSPQMLAQMQAKFGPNRNLDCRLGGAEKLPLEDGDVDYAFANMYLHHVEDPAAAIQEMARILKPGGRLVITDLDLHDHQFLVEEHHDRWMGFARPDVRRWLEAAGLQETRVDSIEESCASTSAQGEQASVSIFIASGASPR